jgi:hypothetical protein
MNRKGVENLEKVTGQIEGLHREISLLAKKSSNDGLNLFKLKMLNAVLSSANVILGKSYKPIEGFDQFDLDAVPSNSDATVVLTAYLEELERFRADSIKSDRLGRWHYTLEEGAEVRTSPPKKLSAK